jgi:hypothetical protein
MGKYEPLAHRLRDEKGDVWAASFEEVEAVLGSRLPASARAYREWWANQRGGGHSQTKGWHDAGWQVWKVDLAAEQVTFRRARVGDAQLRAAEEDETTAAMVERAGELLGIADRDQILREALRSLIQREAGRHLIAMGGTMPDLQVPRRRRSAAF